MERVTVFLGGPLDGSVVLGRPLPETDGARFEVVNRGCPVWVNGAVNYRRHLYQIVGRRVGAEGEELLVEHVCPVPAGSAGGSDHARR
jgi:hypothetical protein